MDGCCDSKGRQTAWKHKVISSNYNKNQDSRVCAKMCCICHTATKRYYRQMAYRHESLEPEIYRSQGHKTCSQDRMSYIMLFIFLHNPLLGLLLYKNLWLLCHNKAFPVFNTLLSQTSPLWSTAACFSLMVTIANYLTLTKSRTESTAAGCGGA